MEKWIDEKSSSEWRELKNINPTAFVKLERQKKIGWNQNLKKSISLKADKTVLTC